MNIKIKLPDGAIKEFESKYNGRKWKEAGSFNPLFDYKLFNFYYDFFYNFIGRSNPW